MLVSSPPFHGGEPGAAPGSPTKHFGLRSVIGNISALHAEDSGIVLRLVHMPTNPNPVIGPD